MASGFCSRSGIRWHAQFLVPPLLGELLANGIACSSVTYAHFIYKLAAKWKKRSERLRGMQCHLSGLLLFTSFSVLLAAPCVPMPSDKFREMLIIAQTGCAQCQAAGAKRFYIPR